MVWRQDGPRTLYCADGSKSNAGRKRGPLIQRTYNIDVETGKY
jgi:hypothetical protein